MNIETSPFNAYSIFTNDENNSSFQIPEFQREYSWGQKNWETFFNDLMEFKEGYFIGSMIFVKTNNKKTDLSFQVIDGQQRLVTISILLLALYTVLKKETKQTNSLEEIISALFRIESKRKWTPRLLLQTLNNEDYQALLSEHISEWSSKHSVPSNAGNRKIYKAYNYFCKAIQSNKDRGAYKLLSILKKIQIVAIVVKSYPDASVLFSSLNTRGIPLTTIDLIKNSLFSNSKNTPALIKDWDKLINLLDIGDSYQIQERFFRQNYNAFKTEAKAFLVKSEATKQSTLPSEATRANIFKIYDVLFKVDTTLNWCLKNAVKYSNLLKANTGKKNIDRLIEQLNFIEGSPSHTLLLYLYCKQDSLALSDPDLENICKNLNHFFIRRHLTDKPATRTLDNFFAEQISQIEKQKLRGSKVKRYIVESLKTVAASDEEFEKALEGNLYKTRKLARYVLANLYPQGKELDFWQKEKNKKNQLEFKWTIEHVMPQTLSDVWKKESFPGLDEEKIKQQHALYVHKLGNLTLSGYNAELNNERFIEKRDKKDCDTGIFIGYKNGIQLNQSLKNQKTWNIDQIKKRTTKLCELAKKVLQLSNRSLYVWDRSLKLKNLSWGGVC